MAPGSPKSDKPYRRAPSGVRGDRTGHKGPRQKRARAEKPDAIARDPAARPPVVAIVGRPNVGKSTLLNAFARSLVSIVEPTPGVTRDRVSVLVTLADRSVELVDTGGIGIVDRQGLAPFVEKQVDEAVARAAVVLFVVDARDGVMPLDRAVADRLRPCKVPVLLVANKAETERVGWAVGEMHALGYGEPLKVSAKEGHGLDRLEAELGARLPAGPTTPRRMPEPALQLAVVGRVNAGKSSLVNALVHEERMIVSEVPGTTRDSVDVRFELDGKTFVAIDTPGLKRMKSLANDLEFYSIHRAQRSVRRADVVLLFFDAGQRISKVDKQLCQYIDQQYKPCIFVVNKWDLALEKGMTSEKWSKYLFDSFASMRHVPVALVTAKDSRNIRKLINLE